jgi:undecaprenyl-diphosphatase
MLAFTAIGRGGMVWIAIAVAGVLLRRARAMAMWQVGLALLLTLLVTEGILKPLVHEPRPFVANPGARIIDERPSTYSFPSGHATSSFAAAVSLSRAWPQGTAAWFVLASLVSLSRVYVGVHTPLDVLGGVIIGLACGYFAIGRSRWSPPRRGSSRGREAGAMPFRRPR